MANGARDQTINERTKKIDLQAPGDLTPCTCRFVTTLQSNWVRPVAKRTTNSIMAVVCGLTGTHHSSASHNLASPAPIPKSVEKTMKVVTNPSQRVSDQGVFKSKRDNTPTPKSGSVIQFGMRLVLRS